ncbi:MAG: hypothetical protein RE469_05450 [Cuniculiplasma divulgatum]|jgi:integrase/recombinase XerD|nr:MAG: hypothetical protein RE469_05450 [Cuniculiplasma divulgatum]
MGRVHGSSMTQTYVHLSGRDQDNAILKAYGIEVKDEAKEIETAIIKSEVVDAPTERIVKSFPDDFKDLILETVLEQIAGNPELRERFQRELTEQGK